MSKFMEEVKKLAKEYKPVKEADLKLHLKAWVQQSKWGNSMVAEALLHIMRRQKVLEKELKKLTLKYALVKELTKMDRS